MCRDRLCIRNDLLQPRLCSLLKTNPFLDVSFAAKGFFGQSDQEHPSAQIIEPGSGTGILMDLDIEHNRLAKMPKVYIIY